MKSLHIIAFDIPYPPNYGGVIDIFFKLKYLNKKGVSITLHCFEYGRKKAKELESFCDTIYYYKRNAFKNPLIGTLPYIVESRNSRELLNNLLLDNEPILFEGLHTTYLLDHPKLKGRYKILRTHNIEHEYYKHLELVESNYFKKYFFRLESDRLRKYEKKIRFANLLCPLSLKDEKYFNKKHSKVRFVPPFHSNENVDIHPLKGNFILYHGNLAVGENNRAALYLCNEVFSKVKFPVVIAGTKPSKELKRKIDKFPHINLLANIDSKEIYHLIQQAHINILYSEQATGVKLKLINSLYLGKFCLVNDKMISGTSFSQACIVCDNAQSFINQINACFKEEFDTSKIDQRRAHLENSDFDLMKATKKMLAVIRPQKQEAVN